MKRLVSLVAGLTLFVPVLHWESSLVHGLNAALETGSAAAAPSPIEVKLPHALETLVHALGR